MFSVPKFCNIFFIKNQLTRMEFRSAMCNCFKHSLLNFTNAQLPKQAGLQQTQLRNCKKNYNHKISHIYRFGCRHEFNCKLGKWVSTLPHEMKYLNKETQLHIKNTKHKIIYNLISSSINSPATNREDKIRNRSSPLYASFSEALQSLAEANCFKAQVHKAHKKHSIFANAVTK